MKGKGRNQGQTCTQAALLETSETVKSSRLKSSPLSYVLPMKASPLTCMFGSMMNDRFTAGYASGIDIIIHWHVMWLTCHVAMLYCVFVHRRIKLKRTCAWPAHARRDAGKSRDELEGQSHSMKLSLRPAGLCQRLRKTPHHQCRD